MTISAQALHRLEALVAAHDLPSRAVGQLVVTLDRLQHERASVTTVRAPHEAVERHVADSLAGLRVPELQRARSVADLGSGGGFPGFALAAALPEATVSLVESVQRKCRFLAGVTADAGFDNVRVVCERIETCAQAIGEQDVVTARALAPLPVLVEYGAPLLGLDGALVAWKGRRDRDEERDGETACAALGMELVACHDVGGHGRRREERHLYVYVKRTPTPEGYPRRVGVARKRPFRARGHR